MASPSRIVDSVERSFLLRQGNPSASSRRTESPCVSLFDVIKHSSNSNLNEHHKNSTTVKEGEILPKSQTESNVDS